MADIQLTQVAILSKEDHAAMTGGAHYHVFKNDKTGEEVIERTTAEQHALQKSLGGIAYNPKKEDHTWVATFGTIEFDTASGMLEKGTYAVDGEVAYVKTTDMPDNESVQVASKDIVADKIADTKITAALQKAQTVKDSRGVVSSEIIQDL